MSASLSDEYRRKAEMTGYRPMLAVSGIVGVMVVASMLSVVPLWFTLWGGVLLVAWLQNAWDPTWNDGDGWISAVAAAVLLVVLASAGVLSGLVAGVGRLPVKRFVAATIGGSVFTAAGPVVLLVLWQQYRN